MNSFREARFSLAAHDPSTEHPPDRESIHGAPVSWVAEKYDTFDVIRGLINVVLMIPCFSTKTETRHRLLAVEVLLPRFEVLTYKRNQQSTPGSQSQSSSSGERLFGEFKHLGGS